MTFGSPLVLLVLLLLPFPVAAYLSAQRSRARFALTYPNLPVLARVATSHRDRLRHLPPLLLLLAMTALIVGAARPRAIVRVPRERAAVVLAIDSSGSMRAEDVEPSRMAAAQKAARAFIGVVPDELRVGIVSFDEVADVLIPPTVDRTAVARALDDFDPDGGTAIGDALVESLTLDIDAPATDAPLAAIVLVSDGHNTAGSIDPIPAAQRAESAGIPVYTIALGTDEGVVVVPDGRGGSALQQVPPDPETLASIAEITNGEFFDAPSEEDLRSIYEGLGSKVGFRDEQRDVTNVAVAGGAVLAVSALAVGLRRRSRIA